MTDLRTAAQQALECLKGVARGKYDGNAAEVCAALEAALAQQRLTDAQQEMERSIESLKAALAQRAEPVEPYCYVYEYDGVFGLHREFYPFPYNGMKPSRTVPVYTTPPQQAEPDTCGYASRLAVAIWEKHYKDAAPQWKPLDDLMGVLTQIDNMTSGLTRLAKQAEPVEPVALKHRHEWFRTGGMEPDQFRCIHCGVWGQEQSDPQIEDRLARHGIPKP